MSHFSSGGTVVHVNLTGMDAQYPSNWKKSFTSSMASLVVSIDILISQPRQPVIVVSHICEPVDIKELAT